MKKLCSVLLVLVMAMLLLPTSAWATGTVSGLPGSGTESDPYRIGSLEELIWFRNDVNTYTSTGANQYTGKFVKLTTDIDLDGINWEPIGNNTQGDHMSFNGTFDGGGHTIFNLCVEKEGSNLGFFARTGNYAEQGGPAVRNLTFHNVTVKSTNGGTHIGGVVGNSGGNTTLSGIKLTGELDISGKAYVGGVVGHGYPKLDNCSVEAAGTIACTYWCCGGMVGYGGEGGTRITNASVTGTGDGLTVTTVAGGAAAVCGLSVSGNYFEKVSAANVTVVSLGNGYNPDYCLGYIAGNGEESTLKELAADNVVVTAGEESGTPTDVAAKVGRTLYGTFALAMAAADAGDTVELLRDAALTTKLTIDEAITIDGNGHSILADANAVWYTISGKLNIKSYKTHLLGLNSDGITLKNIVLDNNGNAAGINLYRARNVVFDNVSVINATKGFAALTVNGSTLTAKTALTIRGNSVAIDVDQGSGVTEVPGMTIEAGTVTDLDNKTVKFANGAVMELSGAVTAGGAPYFAAKDNAYYYTRGQMNSCSTAYGNGLCLQSDVELDRDMTIKGTLDLNGNDLTMAVDKVIKLGSSLVLTGEGAVEGEFVLTDAAHTLTAPEGLAVTTAVEGKWPVYSQGVYELADMAARIDGKGYSTLAAAANAVKSGQTITLLTDNDEKVNLRRSVAFVLETAGYDMTGDIASASTTCVRTVTEEGTRLAYTFKITGSTNGVAAAKYAVSVAGSENGTVTVDTATAKRGNKVTISVNADQGYTVAGVAVTDETGENISTIAFENRYVFTMPAADVTVTVVFTKIEVPVKPIGTNPFVDVTADDYFYAPVLWAVENAVTGGTSATTFGPTEVCTRAQAVTFLWNAAGKPEPVSEVNPFADVDETDWFCKAVLWAMENGITAGTGADTFSPDSTVTRAQNITFLWRYLNMPAADTESSFSDVEDADYFRAAVNWAAEEDITSGTSDSTFSPDAPCLRGQIITFLYRAMTE